MSDSWDDRRRAQEDGYFEKMNQQALERLKARKGGGSEARLSPVTGKPMEQVTVMGVVVDRCLDSGGIWLDAGELDQIIKAVATSPSTGGSIADFFSQLLTKKY
jgi:hypothetical protein